MLSIRQFLLLMLVINVVTAGCVRTEPGVGVSFEFEGSVNPAPSGFGMKGYVEVDGGIPPQETYRDVTVCLYSSNGTLQDRERLGDLTAAEQLNVSASKSYTPHYIIIDSTDLDKPNIGSEYYRLIEEDNYYRGHLVASSDGFPVERCA